MNLADRMVTAGVPGLRSRRWGISITWWLCVLMSVLVFALIVWVLWDALGLINQGESAKWKVGLILGGMSVVQFLTTVVWGPWDHILKSTLAGEGMDIIVTGLSEELDACAGITDPAAKETATKAAVDTAVSSIQSLLDKLFPK
jgi:hypothetical protein